MTPMGAIVHGTGGAMEAQTVGMAASQMAQQQGMSQLAGFNGQIKSKDDVTVDDVTVQYQLVATGQTSPVLQNTLQGKAKSDGEEVLTPLLQQAATAVLGHVGKKLKATRRDSTARLPLGVVPSSDMGGCHRSVRRPPRVLNEFCRGPGPQLARISWSAQVLQSPLQDEQMSLPAGAAQQPAGCCEGS